jgi:acyl-CoA thioesterase
MNVTLDPRVTGFGGAHGGYVMSLALRAIADAAGEPDRPPRSLTMHLLAAIGGGALDLEPRVERRGGSMTAVSLRAEQDGATVAAALASFGRSRPSLEHSDGAMPRVPPPGELEPLMKGPVPEALLQVEHRPAAPPLPLSGGDRAELAVWMRRLDDTPVDPYVATFLADAAAPALYGALAEYVPMPSTDITLHFAPPAEADGPWVLAVVRNRFAAGGYALEDGELWAPDGRLLLRSRQMRRVLGY